MGLAFIRVIQIGIKSLMLRVDLCSNAGHHFWRLLVIAMLAIGEGASYEAQEAIRKLGSRNIIIRSVQPPKGQSAADSKRTYTATYGLKTNDVAHLMETVLPSSVRWPNAGTDWRPAMASAKRPARWEPAASLQMSQAQLIRAGF